MNEKQSPLAYLKSHLSFVYLVVALFALRWTIVEPYVVPTGSMEPTLKTGDRLYALKCAYDVRFPFTDYILFRTGEVKRGDVILFKAPTDPSVTFVKRALGLPGDKIEFRNGHVFINGKEIEKTPIDPATPDRQVMYDIEYEKFKTLYFEQLGDVKHYAILSNYDGNLRNYQEVTIPPGHLFAVGDNRDNSSDSRAWGFVPMENLKGRAMFIWFSSWDWRVRPERIGTLIQ